MSKKADTGDPTDYDAVEEAMLEAAIQAMWDDYASLGGDARAHTVRVSGAVVEWAGSTMRSHGGVRTVRLENLNLAPLAPLVTAATAAAGLAARAHPATSHRAVGWHAQIRELTASQRGYQAAARAGLSPSRERLVAWLSDPETTQPSKANREKIAAAYDNLRNWDVVRTSEAARAANHALAEGFTAVVRTRYEVEVRLHGPGPVTFRLET